MTARSISLQLVTRFHDWGAGDTLETALRLCARAGWIGDASSMQTDWKKSPRPIDVAGGESGIGQILSLLPRNPRRARALDVTGQVPAPWELHLVLAPFEESARRVVGINVMTLVFEESLGREGGWEETFDALAARDLCEVAWMHERTSADRLYAKVARNPAYTGPIFPCVYWQTHVGRTVLDHFDLERLGDLSPAVHREDGRGGFVLRLGSSAEAAANPEGERMLLTLTDRFRSARRQ
jgi:hypothetical protein